MANITSFSVQSPYDQQMEELKRRQRMAELMQQEAMQPLESQVAPGGMVVPTSPVLGLAKLLQSYMSGKQLRDIEKQRGEAEQRAGTEAMDFLRTIRQGEPSKDAALAASLSPTPTESIRVPLSPTERQTRIESAFLGGSPQMKLAAQLASMKPESEEYGTTPIRGRDGKYYLVSKTGNVKEAGFEAPEEKLPTVSQATVMRDGRKVVIDANTGREIGQAPAEEITPYQRRMLELRGQELAARTTPGKTPMSATAQKELFQADENVASTATGISMLEDALKLSGKAYEGPAAYQRAYVATTLPNAIEPAGAAETIEFDNLLKQQVLPQMKSIFGANPTEGERAILLDMQGSSNLPKNVREAIIKRGIEAAKRRMAFEQQKAQRLRSGEYFAEPKLPAGFEIEGQ